MTIPGPVTIALALFFFSAALFISGDHYAWAKDFEQETYLFMKHDTGAEPWPIIKPAEGVAWGKLEYKNWTDLEGFCFDFKAYNLSSEEYALIYYVDPGPGPWSAGPEVYVFGIALADEDEGEIKIDGCCDIPQLPILGDVNYPNGAKIWLVPTTLLNNGTGVNACEWAHMTDWDSTAILFESSLVTFGFVVNEEPVE